MELIYGKQLSEISFEIDLFIGVSNHESRSYTLYDSVKEKINGHTLFLTYDDVSNKRNAINYHKVETFRCVNDILKNKLSGLKKNDSTSTIVVDYSCMTKSWYYTIMLFFKYNNNDLKSIKLIFSYTPSKYSEPKLPKYNKYIRPIPGKFIIQNDKPKALIVCLGYEQNKAEGIIEHLEPKKKVLLYTDPAIEDDYVKKVVSNNESLLEENKDNTFTYPYDDLLFLERKLTDIYEELKQDYSIIIAPLGSKPFTLVSMLLSIRFTEIDVWGVESGSDMNYYKGEPQLKNGFVICETLFVKK